MNYKFLLSFIAVITILTLQFSVAMEEPQKKVTSPFIFEATEKFRNIMEGSDFSYENEKKATQYLNEGANPSVNVGIFNFQNYDDQSIKSISYTALFKIAYTGEWINLIPKLIKKGADVNLTIEGKTALTIALENEHPEVALKLLKYGALPNNGDLHLAIHNSGLPKTSVDNNYNNVAVKLIEMGANINQKVYHSTPLELAILANNQDMINYLINKGANIEYVNGSNETPLLIAARMNNTEAVNLFINKGANINVQDIYGNTAMDQAVLNGNAKMVKILKAAGANGVVGYWEGRSIAKILEKKANKTNKIQKLLNFNKPRISKKYIIGGLSLVVALVGIYLYSKSGNADIAKNTLNNIKR